MMVIRTQGETEQWLTGTLGVSRETIQKLACFGNLLTNENERQNLVARSTLGPEFWVRHVADSAQLLAFAPLITGGGWTDIGSGPGLPGLIIALLEPRWSVVLIETRVRRCEFLRQAVANLDIGDRVQVIQRRVEDVRSDKVSVISARAFAPLHRLIQASRHLANPDTIWVLPKGENAVNELSTLPQHWQTMFHVEPSVTHPDAKILVGRGDFAN